MLQRIATVARQQSWRYLSTTASESGRSSSHHQLNISKALKKSDEHQSFEYLTKQPVETLQGIGPKHAEDLHSLNLHTIEQLANYKFFHLARAIVTLAEVEEPNGRLAGTLMNLDKGLDKKHESKSLNELVDQPVHILQGVSPRAGETLSSLGAKTVKDLANFKYCEWAEAIVECAKFEDDSNS